MNHFSRAVLAATLLLISAYSLASNELSIGEIHGDSSASPWLNEQVTTEGIVTLVLPFGFWMQTPSEQASSGRDGIHVFTGQTAAVGEGDRVRVTGYVDAFSRPDRPRDLTVTRLIQPEIDVIASDQPQPAAVVIGPDGLQPPQRLVDEDDRVRSSDSAVDFWTRLMGMRVVLNDHRVTGPSNRYGDAWVIPDPGHPELNELGVLVATPESLHLDRVLVTEHPLLKPDFPRPALPGDRFQRIVGVVHYDYGNFRVLATHALNPQPSNLKAPVNALRGGPDHLLVASYNVENLNPVIERLGRVAGPGDVDDAIGSGRMAALGRQIAVELNQPDIIALQEIQDNNGAENDDVVSADRTYAALIQSIVDAGGPAYAFIDLPAAPGSEGGQPGGNIRNGYLYNPERVTLVDNSPERLEDKAFEGSRRSILAVFEFNGQRVNLINNHFSSKWGSSPLFGRQPMITGGAEERPAQARAIRRFLREQNAWRDQTHWIVLGDFNDHWFSETLDLLKGDESRPLHNLIETLPRDDRWTYIFEGTGQAIDHMLVTPSLLDRAEFQVIHINARHINQTADHEPLLGRFHLPAKSD